MSRFCQKRKERAPWRSRGGTPRPGPAGGLAAGALRALLPVLLALALALPALATAKPKTAEPPARVVNMLAERFFFVPSRLKVKQGTTVEFRIRSADTNHGFRIRKAGINIVVPKRGKGLATVIFHAKEKGRYDFECSKPCGAGHNFMRGTIIVE